MTEFIPQADVFASLLLTYLIHSTVVVALIGGVLFCWTTANADVRVLFWKAALVVPIATTWAVNVVGLPQVGPEFHVSVASTHEQHGELKREATSGTTGPIETDDIRATNSPSHRDFAGLETANASPDTSISAAPSGPLENLGEAARVREREGWANSAASVPIWSLFVLVYLVFTVFACIQLTFLAIRLRSMRRRSLQLADESVNGLMNRLCEKADIRYRITLLQTEEAYGPMTGGIIRPYIIVPSGFLERLSQDEREALFAHELAHISRRDSLWKLIAQIICRVFVLQPLNRVARRQLEIAAEFVADEHAARLLDQRSGLAGCLARLGEWLVVRSVPVARTQPLAAGMASFRSTLGCRVEALLKGNSESKLTPRLMRTTTTSLIVAVAVMVVSLSPRAVADSNRTTSSDQRIGTMKRQLTLLAVLAGLTLPTAADERQTKEKQPTRPPITKKTADELPDGIARFNGMLVGRLVKKDVEKGTFILNVDAVPRVWRNSKAEDPKSIVGKNIEVDGVSGKWLDVLLVVKEGETLECEARHDGGGRRLTFPGELLRKVGAFNAKDYPALPEQFRGFQGAVAGKIVKKDAEMFELIVQVDRVMDTWKSNKAKDAKSIVGKQMMLAGFWRRKDMYHGLKVGDQIEAGMQHISPRSDHLTVAEFVRKASKGSPDSPEPNSPRSANGGFQGFVGALVGTLEEKDVEKGTLVLNVQAVPRVFRNNKARQPKSLIGKTVQIDGVSNRLLDVLLTTKKGETLEIATRHDRGDSLTFLGELFRKVAPYKAADYPVLPDGIRGFQGVVVGKIVKKDKTMFGLIVQVDEVKRSWDKSQAKNPESIVGKTATIAGFWRRKEIYGELKVGDRIETGLQHQVAGTDVLSVAEFVRKTSKDTEPKGKRTDKQPREGAEKGKDTPVSFPAGMRGFEGALFGQLASKDVERGEFALRVEKVLSVTKQSKAPDIKSCQGRTLTIRGLKDRYLDELLLFKPGDRMEVGVIHLQGDHLNFSIYAGKFRKAGKEAPRKKLSKEDPR